jgi:hypothetical protein
MELNQMMQDASEQDSHHQTSSNQESVREYADLLRQRRYLRKLEIVQDALAKLLDVEPNPASTDIKATIKEELGEPPQAPVAVASGGNGGSEADARFKDLKFLLKKELLIAKNKFADTKAAKQEPEKQASGRSELDASQKLAILRDARDELITWVESELAKIPEDEVEASQAEISFLGDDDGDGGHGRQLTNEELSSRVDQLYERYLQSRQRYIEEVEATLERGPRLQDDMQATGGAASRPQSRAVSSAASTTKPPTISAADLLPSSTHLNTTTHSASLLQSQTAHLRKQLITASSETQTLIQRLAGESLLVPQDSKSVAAWSKSAQEASEKTKESVMANVIEGEASVAQAKKVLEGLKARRRGLESLRRDL